MSLLQACQMLRADITANGGTADRPTLHRIAMQGPPASSLGVHAAWAINDVGTDLWSLDAAQMAGDCSPVGIQIPF